MSPQPPITAATRVAAVIGDPASHSLSPAIHNAAFAERGLDWVYVALRVPAEAGEAAVRAVADLGLGGMSVTMPHKAAAARACERLTETAAVLGSVNTVVPERDGLLGESTDGAGFLRAVGDEGVDDLAGARAVVLGTGGAARAIVHALGLAGGDVTVAGRRAEEAASCAALAPHGRAVAIDAVGDHVPDADLVVNATPLGMAGEDPPFDTTRLAAATLVVDTVYAPRETPLLAGARAAGARAVNGIPMLVHQAALAFERWTGVEAPLLAMHDAAARA